ncbi:unnamed protein product [Absidia cylindrospora]
MSPDYKRERSLSPYSKRQQINERPSSSRSNSRQSDERRSRYDDNADRYSNSNRNRHLSSRHRDDSHDRHDSHSRSEYSRGRDGDRRDGGDRRRRYEGGNGYQHRDPTSFTPIEGGPPIIPGETSLEYRRRVRESSDKTIWVDYPPKKETVTKMKRSSRGDDSDSGSDSSSDDDNSVNDSDDSSEDDRRKRHRSSSHRSSKKHRSDRQRKKRSSKKHHHRSSSKKHTSRRRRSPTPDSYASSAHHSASDDDDNKIRPQHQQEQLVLPDEPINLDSEDLWVEKQVDLPDDLAPVGPAPLSKEEKDDERAYGSALLPGEGSAMAAYVKEGKRIPRRGEIGLSGDQIATFEDAGYVMSGSRHRRMNAVRLRKENQVISAEEKRLLLQHAQDERMRRENDIISEFREVVSDKFKKPE